ncbi:hypothetical protein [Bernardetia sp.]|uniref:hypothetical protein n=1 Tax=Bernardetia sp. TaxID=1937974 RepID=UPI0025C5459D|nr:hypothetical protein [Bernardetia sp.]
MAKNDTKQESVTDKPVKTKNRAKRTVDQVEKQRRVRMVAEWMMQGNSVEDIMSQIRTMWGLKARQPYTYVQWALDLFKKSIEQTIKERLSFHIATRMRMYKSILEDKELKARERYTLALGVLKDIASLEGLYEEKIHISAKTEHTETIEITLDLGETSDQQEGEQNIIIPLQTSVDNELSEGDS